ncbi:antibiotic biosynthesis monooxygenase family protein [Lewinella sp. IMCC34191]|uniref:antibiotic biosynthesis monooxygenase family protein n=1 Tax=Lewinella sp. IMCC34191 TaxID=2259172 RepID=UPI000E247FF9|nr:antibiotic biosynthesis monooxygenase [Lewinella sp. IMCC34191]
MLTVFAEHYLTPEGRMYFPNWTTELGQALTSCRGFQKLEVVEDVERPDRLLLLLGFEDTESLMRWSSSQEHRRLAALLERHQLRKPYTQLLAATG